MRSLLALTLVILTTTALFNCGGEAASTTSTPVVHAQPQPATHAVNSHVINSEADFDQALKTYADRLVVVDFHAEWCGPCKLIAPELAAVASANAEHMMVLTVDIDHLPKLADRYQVESIPLLVQIKDGKEVKRRVGAFKRDNLATWMDMQVPE